MYPEIKPPQMPMVNPLPTPMKSFAIARHCDEKLGGHHLLIQANAKRNPWEHMMFCSAHVVITAQADA
jgi:hypothetical protein